MKNKKGFTLIELLIVISIIGVLALMGLRVYGNQQEKAKNAIVKANTGTVQTLIQAELADSNINTRDEAVDIAKAAGLHNPFNGVAMNIEGWFPESADVPGEIQITLSVVGTFFIQGYGADGLLPDILTAKR